MIQDGQLVPGDMRDNFEDYRLEESRARGCGDDPVALPVTLFLLPHPAGLVSSEQAS
ncbi:hypothetical protein [Streptomyces sp. NPDC050416]|uniref:hypothetical protein n=1 Tax=Streptomyces sp. NPDC050416 TaxID=3365611 RepID=UPI0037B3556C